MSNGLWKNPTVNNNSPIRLGSGKGKFQIKKLAFQSFLN